MSIFGLQMRATTFKIIFIIKTRWYKLKWRSAQIMIPIMNDFPFSRVTIVYTDESILIVGVTSLPYGQLPNSFLCGEETTNIRFLPDFALKKHSKMFRITSGKISCASIAQAATSLPRYLVAPFSALVRVVWQIQR